MYFLPCVGVIDKLSTIPPTCVISLLEMPMFTDFERFQRFIIAIALIVLALDLFYWRP
jgi:hypothetical protein